MVPTLTKIGYVLKPGTKKGNRRGYQRGVLLGTVSSNTPAAGELSMWVSAELYGHVMAATVPYRFISIIQRVVPIMELVETATSPGAVAIGSALVGGTLLNPRVRLVHVKF